MEKTDGQLIAEFMGARGKIIDGEFRIDYKQEGMRHFWSIPRYDTSWDWLMPVVIKCHEFGDAEEQKHPESKSLDDPTGWRAWSYRRVRLSTDIEQVYTNVGNFIRWYNTQPKQS